ncbi:hypothetical protein FKM82_031176 [Ascaphus truei]
MFVPAKTVTKVASADCACAESIGQPLRRMRGGSLSVTHARLTQRKPETVARKVGTWDKRLKTATFRHPINDKYSRSQGPIPSSQTRVSHPT